MKTEKEVKNVSEYITYIREETQTLHSENCNRNKIFLFRGQPDSKYELLPSIARVPIPSGGTVSMLDSERNMLETAKYEKPDIFKDSLQPIDLLALAQHHGIPTRLLDVTENPLVALYFACTSNNDVENGKDGEVIVFIKNEKYFANNPLYNGIADSYRFVQFGTNNDKISVNSFYLHIIEQPYFQEFKYLTNEEKKIINAGQDKGVYGINIELECTKILYVHASVQTKRQEMQQSSFILFPNTIKLFNSNLEDPVFLNTISAIKRTHRDIHSCITIPSKSKADIIDELKMYGITKERLFSDNTDTYCEGVKNKYLDRKSPD